VRDEICGDCRLCLQVCPAHQNDHRPLADRPGIDRLLWADFGPVLEIWEGYAGDAETRRRGASGGAISALALYCLECEHAHGVLHLQGDPDDPIRNRTVLSVTRAEVLAGTGSRYSPGSVCDGLALVEAAPAPCVFIGQPCELTALRKAQALRPVLRDKVSVAISFFCAGSPATAGTVEAIRKEGIDPCAVSEVRYRGHGWPGAFGVRLRGEAEFRPLRSYQEAWGALQKYRPYGIFLFPDMSGDDADVSCADAWHRPGDGGDGYSLVVVRTERGRQVVEAARKGGYLVLERVDGTRLRTAQRALLGRRGLIWGRSLAFRLLGLPAPVHRGFEGAAAWRKLPLRDKLKSVLGTARRVIQRGYYRPLTLAPADCVPRKPAASQRPVNASTQAGSPRQSHG